MLGHLSATLQHDHVLQLGEAQLTEVDFLAPIRRGTLVALGVVTYLDQLHICMHYDAQRMPRMAAEDLLCRITSGLERLLSVAPGNATQQKIRPANGAVPI